MLLLAGGLLAASAGLTQVIHVRESRADDDEDEDEEAGDEPEGETEKDKPSGAFALVLKNPYLRLLAAFSLVFTLVNTNGEYMISELVGQFAREVEAAGELGEGVALRDYIAAWYGEFYLYVNIAGVVLQTFVVSRLIKYLGITPTFLILPVVALIDGGLIAAFPMLAILKWGKVAENSIDYSVNNTVRNMLWLPTTREMKYKAKQAIDTLAKIVTYAMTINVFFVLMEVFTALYSDIPEHVNHFQFLFIGLEGENTLAPWMWVSSILAIVSLIVLINPKTRGNYGWLKFGCVAVVGSLWIDKGLGMVIAGFVPNPLGKVVHYWPTAPELMISLAIYAVGALILTGLYKIALEVRGQLKTN